MSQESRSPRRSRRRDKPPEFVFPPRLEGLVAVGVAVLGALYLMIGVQGHRAAIGFYAGAPVNGTREEVLYFRGRPDRVVQMEDGERWIYQRSGPITIVRFVDGRARAVSCEAGRTGPLCPAALGVSIGDDEYMVATRLGSPAATTLHNGRRLFAYDEVGFVFVMEEAKVRRIVAVPARGGLARRLGRLIYRLIP